MKFGSQLSQSIFPEWRFYYLDYDSLKRQLKTRVDGPATPFNDQDEAAFVEFMERELEKVSAFRDIKGDELKRRIEHCETVVKSILATEDPDEERFTRLDEETTRIANELSELSKFIRLNYTGFLKILKKHDKHTAYMLKPMFMVRLTSRPFFKENNDDLIIRLSKIFDVVRNRGVKSQALGIDTTPAQSFVRTTKKYWVHIANVTEVKCIILKYLPVLVIQNKGQAAQPSVSSVYLDNESFDLYLGRMESRNNAEAIRFRWYGNSDQEIYVEQKVHKDDYSGESSVKRRFQIKEKYLDAYLRGENVMERQIQKLRERKSKSEQEIKDLETLASEIQASIVEKKVHPVIRTIYNRVAFQLPGDSGVRISLDTDLVVVREDNTGKTRSGDHWRRTDASSASEFLTQFPEDVYSFPYAILEVKTQTHLGAQAPSWVEELVSSHLVQEVSNFSKFVHGAASVFENRVPLLPFWLPQMDNILKPEPSNYRSPTVLDHHRSLIGSRSSITTKPPSPTKSRSASPDAIEIVVDDPNESTPLLGNSSTGSGSGSLKKRTSWATLAETFKSHHQQPPSPPVVIPERLKENLQKRIAVPVRVEPKVFFANERTFLSWLNFTMVLGGMALSLLNFGDRIGQLTGLIFTVIAMLFMGYSLYLYQWRVHRIRERDPRPFDDRWGPTVLVLVLFSAVVVNFWMKFSNPGDLLFA
ncbi:VTC domain-containing protein [Polychytrium aggregatum]|uniref:VTC domain-containing protein n=1 Tax=Polychytrium aggregatum TaxID=110093 RepID=UPI0022FEA4D0|nr:VTC domain-containing protein [Polychytrium aggregatum]KAI9204619.1 VTC domain-containing protein [Polychytrium aggregatum]